MNILRWDYFTRFANFASSHIDLCAFDSAWVGPSENRAWIFRSSLMARQIGRSIRREFNLDITQLHVGQAMFVLHSCSAWGRSARSQSLETAPTPSLHSIVLLRIPVPQVTEHCINKKVKCTLCVQNCSEARCKLRWNSTNNTDGLWKLEERAKLIHVRR